MVRILLFVCSATMLALCGPVIVGNQSDALAEEPSAEDIKKARKYFERARKYQRQKDYERAAEDYLRSYDYYPNAELLFNAAQVQRVGGQIQEALENYRAYLELQPNGRASDEARRWERTLSRYLEKDDDPDEDLGSDLEDTGDFDDMKEDEAEEDEDDDEGEDERDDRSNAGSGLRSAGIVFGLAGSVAIGIGIKNGMDAKAISDELSNQVGPWTDETLARQEEGRKAQGRMLILVSAGTAAVVTGIFMWSRGNAARNERLSAVPVITDESIGFALGGSF